MILEAQPKEKAECGWEWPGSLPRTEAAPPAWCLMGWAAPSLGSWPSPEALPIHLLYSEQGSSPRPSCKVTSNTFSLQSPPRARDADICLKKGPPGGRPNPEVAGVRCLVVAPSVPRPTATSISLSLPPTTTGVVGVRGVWSGCDPHSSF